MGNTSTKPHIKSRNKKQVHWKAADRPAPPGKPQLVSESELDRDVVHIHWTPPRFDGGSPIKGYLVEHRRLGSPHWVRATPLLVKFCEVTISGLEPGWKYQFRVSAENAVGLSAPSELSDELIVTLQRAVATIPKFDDELNDAIALENDKIEFTVQFQGQPGPKVCWFKDGFEIFSSRRIRIVNDNFQSVLTIHQCALSDEGEIKCTITNRSGHTSTKAKLTIEAPPSIRLPRQYEDGLLFELGEAVRLKVAIAGRPASSVVWSHNNEPIENNEHYEIETTDKYSSVRIGAVQRSDRGEYHLKALNKLGEANASFLVTVTDKPAPPEQARVVMTLGRSVTLSWSTPVDDGGCKIGNYIVEYFRIGWDVWLKASTCRQLSTTVGELIEGSQYKFRVKAESPYGVSEPSNETDVIFIPDPSRGILTPSSRSRSEVRQIFHDTVPKRQRSQSGSRSETSPHKTSTAYFYKEGIPVRPPRYKTKSTSATPEVSPIVGRRSIPIKNVFDRTSVVRDMAYGSPEIRQKSFDYSDSAFLVRGENEVQTDLSTSPKSDSDTSELEKEHLLSARNKLSNNFKGKNILDSNKSSYLSNSKVVSSEEKQFNIKPTANLVKNVDSIKRESSIATNTKGETSSFNLNIASSIIKESNPLIEKLHNTPGFNKIHKLNGKGSDDLNNMVVSKHTSDAPSPNEESYHEYRKAIIQTKIDALTKKIEELKNSPDKLSEWDDHTQEENTILSSNIDTTLTHESTFRSENPYDSEYTMEDSKENFEILLQTKTPPLLNQHELSLPKTKRHAENSNGIVSIETKDDDLRSSFREKSEPLSNSSEFMLLLVPYKHEGDSIKFEFDESTVPPPMSLSAPELGVEPPHFDNLRPWVSSTELLHEYSNARLLEEILNSEKQSNIPKIQINSKDNQKIVGLERNNSTRRRLSAGSTTPHALWKLRTGSLRNSFESSQIPENTLRKFEGTLDEENYVTIDNKRKLLTRQRSESEEREEAEFERLRTKTSLIKQSDKGAGHRVKIAQEGYWTDEESPLESDSNSFDNEKPRVYNVDIDDDDDDLIYHPGLMRLNNNEPFEILTKRNSLPDPNFIPKPILKRPEKVPSKPIRKAANTNSFAIYKQHVDSMSDIEQKSFVSEQAPHTRVTQKVPKMKKESTPIQIKKIAMAAEISGITAASVGMPKRQPTLQRQKSDEEVKVVVDHYGDIVRSYGQKSVPTIKPLYLNTEELKAAADDESEDDISKNDEQVESDVENLQEAGRGNRRGSFLEVSSAIFNKVKERVATAFTPEPTDDDDDISTEAEIMALTQRRGSAQIVKRRPSKLPVNKGESSKSFKRSSLSSSPRSENWSHLRTPSPTPGRRSSPISSKLAIPSSGSQVRRNSLSSILPPSPTRPKTKEITTQTHELKRELSVKTELKVRSAIDYITDVAMFLLACWLYLFHNELLAIPVLAVMVYRQLKEEIKRRLPNWISGKKNVRRK